MRTRTHKRHGGADDNPKLMRSGHFSHSVTTVAPGADFREHQRCSETRVKRCAVLIWLQFPLCMCRGLDASVRLEVGRASDCSTCNELPERGRQANSLLQRVWRHLGHPTRTTNPHCDSIYLHFSFSLRHTGAEKERKKEKRSALTFFLIFRAPRVSRPYSKS